MGWYLSKSYPILTSNLISSSFLNLFQRHHFVKAQNTFIGDLQHPDHITMGQARFRRLFTRSHPHSSTFEKFPNLPCELRLRIWELSLPGPRIVEVRHFRYNNYQNAYCFTSVCSPPIHLRICRESRTMALKHYKFCDDRGVSLFLDPTIDTLYFGATWTNRGDLFNFTNNASQKDLERLENLAVNEVNLPNWRHRPVTPPSVSSAPDVRPTLFSVLKGLKKLIILLSVDIDGDVDNPRLRPDGWNGWLFGGGNPTDEEMRASRDQKQWIFSAFSIGGHLFDVPGRRSREKFPLDAPFRLKGHQLKALEYYYPPNDPVLVRKHKKDIQRLRERANVETWYRRVLGRIPVIDFRVKRLFAMHQRDNVRSDEAWTPPEVACVVRPSGTFLAWEYCLGLVCDTQWQTNRNSTRFAISGEIMEDRRSNLIY